MKVHVTVCTKKGERFSYTEYFPTTVDAVMAALDGRFGVCTVRARAVVATPTLH